MPKETCRARPINIYTKPKTINMSNNRRLFGLGLLTGAAVGYWLNTEKGKAFRRDIAQTVGEYSDELSAMAMESSQNWVSGAKGKLKNSIHDLADTAEHTVDDVAEKLETGLENARRRVQENAAKLENGKSKKK